MTNILLYIVFPYVAIALAIVAGSTVIRRPLLFFQPLLPVPGTPDTFLGVVPWHYGIVSVLLAHIFPLIIPVWWGLLHRGPGRLTALELVGMALGLMALVGIVILIVRRLVNAKARAVTSVMDWLLLVLLLLQVTLGVLYYFYLPLGSFWYLYTAVPWLRSLASFHPDAATVPPCRWQSKPIWSTPSSSSSSSPSQGWRTSSPFPPVTCCELGSWYGGTDSGECESL